MEAMLEKIKLMLEVYRGKLDRASMSPIDYIAGVRIESQIEVLESLYYYTMQEIAKSERQS